MAHFNLLPQCFTRLNVLIPVLLCCLMVLSGCRPESTTDNSQSDTVSVKDVLQNQESQCGKLVSNAIHMCDPERFTIESDPDAVVGLLNDWSTTCAEFGEALPEEEIKKWYGEEMADKVNHNRFNLYDASHIRNCIMYQKIWDHVAQDQEDDLARVVAAFNFVIRNIIQHSEASQIPLKKHEVILWGMGTPEDRAIFFADLLRQARIDSVVITSKVQQEGEKEEEKAWLVGVFLDDGIYLFDTHLGLPIPGPDQDPGELDITDVATLKEIRENDELLRALDADDTKYNLTAADLQEIQVGLIGYENLWMPKYETLQEKMTEENHFLLYDGWIDGPGGQGTISRVLAQADGLYDQDDLKAWDYAAKHAEARENMPESIGNYIREFSQTFSAHFECEVLNDVESEKLSDKLSIKPTKSMAKARLAYMSGKERESIKNYTAIRMISLTDVMPLMQQYEKKLPLLVQTTAMDNAFFWLGVAQIEVGDYQPAIDTLEEYMKQTRGQGRWIAAAHERLVYCYAKVNKPAISVQLAKQLIDLYPENSYEQYRFQLVLKQLRQMQQKQREQKKKAAAEKS